MFFQADFWKIRYFVCKMIKNNVIEKSRFLNFVPGFEKFDFFQSFG